MNNNDLLLWTFNGRHYWYMYMVTFIDCHENPHYQKYRCCGDIQGPSQIMTIMTENDSHHFISTTINNLWLWTFEGRHYWCVYMVAFVDFHHFIFLVRVEKCHQGPLVMVKRASIAKNWSLPFHMDVKARWNRTTNLLLVKQVLFHWASTV